MLVRNLAEHKSEGFNYLIFNDAGTPVNGHLPAGVRVLQLPLKASGFQGIFYDFLSILICWFRVDTVLLLGVQGIPLIGILRIFRKVRVVSNVGGVEWMRPKFGFLLKRYFKWCFNLSLRYSDTVILDNRYYLEFLPPRGRADVRVVPYGGVIDNTLEVTPELLGKYPFLEKSYYLSVSRSLEDNLLEPLCAAFAGSGHLLVLISNLSGSAYGKTIQQKYGGTPDIILIDGLYHKPELDLIRRHCKAYIHTHTLCGTAPSLVEMVVARRPICSIDIPQNRNTLQSQGFLFSDFGELRRLLDEQNGMDGYVPDEKLVREYDWDRIIREYEEVY